MQLSIDEKVENADDTKDPQMCVHNGLQDR